MNDEEGASVGPAESAQPTEPESVLDEAVPAVLDEAVPAVLDEAVPAVSDEAVPTVSAPKPPSALRQWFSRHGTTAAVVAAVVSFVAAGAFAGATAETYLAERATAATKLRIAETATAAITTLWSYTPEDMDSLPDRSAKYLGGDFEEQYRRYVDAIAATNKQAKVSSTTRVVGAAVESLRGGATGTEATAIVYTNTTSTTPQTLNFPSMKYLSYRLDLKRFGRDWRVTKMTTITSLDLTPKL